MISLAKMSPNIIADAMAIIMRMDIAAAKMIIITKKDSNVAAIITKNKLEG